MEATAAALAEATTTIGARTTADKEMEIATMTVQRLSTTTTGAIATASAAEAFGIRGLAAPLHDTVRVLRPAASGARLALAARTAPIAGATVQATASYAPDLAAIQVFADDAACDDAARVAARLAGC